jgi:2,4-dienoyl-CoA reductase-like NADH-dependent reductase (Old Yellow Enzyme family)
MTADANTIFSPFDISGRQLRNRFAVAPMTRVSATEDGNATETMQRYYDRFARGGFGLVITEGLYPDQAYSQGYRFQPGISDDAQALAWKPLVDSMHALGAASFAQIMHAGAISQGNRFRDHAVGPSAVKPLGEQLSFYYGKGDYPMPAVMTEEEIADAIAAFGAAAARAITLSGFDGIEVHGANGYLLDQFLTEHTNLRDDRWGGAAAGRVTLIREIVREVRAAVGSTVPVGVRISQAKVNDFTHKWRGGEADAEAIFGGIADAGADFIHVTEFEAWKPAFEAGGPTLAQLARKFAPATALIVNGGLHEIEQAKAVLSDGADIVAFGRGALSNPDLPNKLQAGEALSDFDPAILGPIANVKDSELA